jgi:hypothetical protein
LGFSNWPVILLHQFGPIKFSGTIITEPSKHNILNKNSYFALKIDMMKAYDHVEWDYLEAIMIKLGFAQQWI